MPTIETTPELVAGVYERSRRHLDVVRARLDGKPLTLAEKIVYGHLDDPENQELAPGKAYLALRPDRVAMQDATAQMALLQFMLAGRDDTAVPSTVHCDHLIRAHDGAEKDLEVALGENWEVYEFLRTACARYGLGFWKPGSGIIHQTVLENYAFPGGLMIGTDSHTPNAGGLGMCAVGVGGADAVDVMAGFPWEVLQPNVVGVELTGELKGWAAPKDVILEVLGQLTVAGGTNRIVEYFGPGADSISATGKGTICNMGAELGATCSVFPYDAFMGRYLRGTRREAIADLADANRDLLRPDDEVVRDPESYYELVLRIDLSELEPRLVGPHTPDLVHRVEDMKEDAAREGYPRRLSYALIGSCTNSSYEDLSRVAHVARQAKAAGAELQSPLMVTPGSEQIHATVERDGQMEALESIGATVLANACGPCIGQWQRDDIEPGETNSIITSFNRNFRGRNDANPETLAFMGSPEVVMAYAFAGSLDVDPLRDELPLPNGGTWKLEPPPPAPDLPELGFVFSREGYVPPPPPEERHTVEVSVPEGSDRLQLLQPFLPLPISAYRHMPLLLKTQGKTTTDHISPAGKWLRYRGHLDNISNNMFIGATNAFGRGIGVTRNPLTGAVDPVPVVARALLDAGRYWCVVGDANYGEGSSREHAAMSPRLLGCAAVIARSFARIHETNLKKQGILPLTFADPADYDEVQEEDEISLCDLEHLAPGRPVKAVFHHADGSEDEAVLHHTLSEEQIGWWRAGSALNTLGEATHDGAGVTS